MTLHMEDNSDDSDSEEAVVSSTTAMAADPLELYLHSPPLANISDPLMYWASQNPSTNLLAQFALDFLSVLGKAFL